MSSSWDSGGISQLQRCSLGSVGHQPQSRILQPLPGAPKPGRGTHKIYGCENQQAFCPPGRDRSLLETQVPSWRDNAQNMICNHLPWAPVEGGQSDLQSHEERWEFVVLGRKLRGEPPVFLCWVSLLYHRCYLSLVEHSPPNVISLGECNNPPSGIPVAPPKELVPWLRSLDSIVEVWANSGGVSDWVVWLWGRDHSPYFPVNLTGTAPQRRSASPTPQALDGPMLLTHGGSALPTF